MIYLKLLTNNRYEYIKTLLDIRPVKIVTFSPINIPNNSELTKLLSWPICILMNTQGFKKQRFYPDSWEIRTNNKIHQKLAISPTGLYLGSWNISINSTAYMHECGIALFKGHPDFDRCWIRMNKEFDELWERSTKKGMV